jgi:hypothetical protein
VNYNEILQIILDRTENLNGDNPEYERGMLEMAADLLARPLVETGERVEQIREDVGNLARAQGLAP